MSNFLNVSRFNELIGNVRGNMNAVDWEQLRAQFDLVTEEFAELARALTDENLDELRDGAADLLVTTYGLCHRAGVDADEDMAIVHRSNMSKFCKDREEALETAREYERIGVQVEYSNPEGAMLAVLSRSDQHDRYGKFYPKGKLLKSVNFHVPEFS